MSNDSRIANIISTIADGFFKLTWIVQRKIHSCHGKRLIPPAIYRIFLLVFLVFTLLGFATGIPCIVLIGMAFLLVFTIAKVIERSFDTLTSVTHFLIRGISAVLVFGMIAFMVICHFFTVATENSTLINMMPVILTTVLCAIFWAFISCLAKNSVGILVNLILTTIVGAIIFLLKYLIEIGLISSLLPPVPDSSGINETQLFNTVIDTLFIPVLFVLGVAALVCAIKKYWIREYNDGFDIDSL